MEPTEFATFQKDASLGLVKLVKTVKTLSSGDIAFNKSLDAEFSTVLDNTNSKVLGLINSLVRNATDGSDVKFENFEDSDSVETRWSVISEVVDFLLEKADMCMDEYTGTVKRGIMQTTTAQSNYKSARTEKRTAEGRKAFNKSLHMVKPQLQFKKPLSPLDSGPHKPRLEKKPHAIKPLQDSLVPTIFDGREKYPHPYLEEISQYKFPNRVHKVAEPIQYKPFESTSAIFVDSPQRLHEMMKELVKAQEIAVDLEHHDFRSYIGLVCLMQVSTREQDWIIDTLKLRDELEVLNEVFANPGIVKVFHGAFMDIIWLQRDLNIYVVGLFDTYDAARSLGFTGHSLAFLLKKYINFDADKSYQLADWRVRPIPQEMLDYARSDTHFLLFIYDNMRNELIGKSNAAEEDKIETVQNNSKETCLKTYDTEPYDSVNGSGSRGWLSILKHNAVNFTDEQFSVFKAVHAWRDRVAREEDDNPHFVMSKNHLLSFARQMPVDAAAALSVSNNPLLRSKLSDLVSTIKEAKANPVPFSSVQHLLVTAGKYWAPQAKDTRKDGEEGLNIMPMLGAGDAGAKTEESQFWGGTFGGSRWEVKDLVVGVNDISLALPLPNLTATVLDGPGGHETQTPIPRADYIKDREIKSEAADIIVIKKLGGGRKRKLEDVTEYVQHNDDDDDDDDGSDGDPDSPSSQVGASAGEAIPGNDADKEDGLETVQLSKLDKRAARKSEKRRKKAEAKRNTAPGGGDFQENGGDDDENEEGEFQAFDYTSAPSIMNAKKESESKAFDGSKKYDGGPKGMRGRRREREGKSSTMKA
ncbi:exosome nuclease subunit [Orbilia oligospora]|uniref:Exosome nuclease subunit n=1 Tax=Orbilia oligospora TaxID=2813651 RepID=A0A7C8UAD1_ORBOL|nr:exosome nuclease subunit [Orbilia oligospora]